MNNVQKNKTAMFEKVELFFNKYQSTLSPFKPLWEIIGTFFSKMTFLDGILQQQNTDTKGETKKKEDLLKQMTAALVPPARKARVWAGQQNDLVLEELFSITDSSFNLANIQSVALARNLLKGLTDNAGALVGFNVSAAQLTDAATDIDNLEASLQTPAQMKNTAKAGTESLVTIINEITALLYDCDDLLTSEFFATDAAMVREYQNNRFIGNAVNRHTTLSVHVFSDDAKTQPLAGATVKLEKYNRSAITNFEGLAVIDQFTAGDLIAIVFAPDYVDVRLPFTIKRAQHLDMEVVMGK